MTATRSHIEQRCGRVGAREDRKVSGRPAFYPWDCPSCAVAWTPPPQPSPSIRGGGSAWERSEAPLRTHAEPSPTHQPLLSLAPHGNQRKADRRAQIDQEDFATTVGGTAGPLCIAIHDGWSPSERGRRCAVLFLGVFFSHSLPRNKVGHEACQFLLDGAAVGFGAKRHPAPTMVLPCPPCSRVPRRGKAY